MNDSKTRNYEKIIELIREIAPPISLTNVILDIEKAVERIGIDVKYSDMTHLKEKDVSGYVFSKNGKITIVVNINDIRQRQRFTIAHELGHVFLHWGWLPNKKLKERMLEVSYRNGEYTDEQLEREEEADKFAAEFLAPRKNVQESLKKYKQQGILDKEKQIELLSLDYNVSYTMAYRLWLEN